MSMYVVLVLRSLSYIFNMYLEELFKMEIFLVEMFTLLAFKYQEALLYLLPTYWARFEKKTLWK